MQKKSDNNLNNNKHYLGHRKRLRDRFNKIGPNSFLEYEIIELLLTYVIPQRDVKPIAKILLNRFDSIKGILDADEEDLKNIPFIKDKFITLIKLIKLINFLYKKQNINEINSPDSIESIANYYTELLGNKKDEEVHILYFNNNFKIIQDSMFPSNEFYFSGTLDKTIVYPRKILEEGLKRKAYGIIIIHNHPNGILEPSEYDKILTKTIDIATKSLGMILFDHLIVSSKGYFSFKKEKLL